MPAAWSCYDVSWHALYFAYLELSDLSFLTITREAGDAVFLGEW